MQNSVVIASNPSLHVLVGRLRAAGWVAMDTEADSLHAYPEKLCLLQFSLPGADELVDPLARIDLAPLWEALSRHEIIFHGADYDLRLLRKNHRFVPRTIFDTMLAARLLGRREFGLGILVENYLHEKLEKGSQKADWARRPLTPRMEKYARNDTRYLKPLSDMLRSELEQRGRLAWHEEMCAWLVRECAAPPADDSTDPWRIKGSHRLGRPGLAVLRELWRWREDEALSANKPPYFILSHEMLVDLAANATTTHDPQSLLPRHLLPERRKTLAEALERGLKTTEHHLPEIARSNSRRPDPAEKRRFEELRTRRDRHARELEMDPTLIASRSTLALLAHDWDRYHPELMTWQRGLLQH